MNLLVTNTRNGQAYCVIRSLRRHAGKIVATVYGKTRIVARFAPAALSRFVDRVYHVPSLIEAWRGARMAESEGVELYIRELFRICEREKINVVFPSWDPQMCAFSLHKQKFTARGILLPVPEWPILSKLIDKYRLMEEAAAAGLPCPRSFLPKDEREALDLAQEVGFPLVVKPRFSSGSRGTSLVKSRSDLLTSIRHLTPTFGMPMVQEYIAGGNEGLINLILVLDREYRLLASHGRRVIRSFSGRFTSFTTAEVCNHNPALTEQAVKFLRRLGYFGHAAFQFQQDPRDGKEKLLEINCRLSYRAWCEAEIGHDLPLLTLKIEKGDEIAPLDPCGHQALFLYPVEDRIGRLLRAGAVRSTHASGAPGESQTKTPSAVFRDCYFKSLWSDPLHALAWYGARLLSASREMRHPAI